MTTIKNGELRTISQLGLDPARTQLVSGLIDTYLKLNAEEEIVFRSRLQEILPEQREEVMQIVTTWMEQGIEQGRQKMANLVVRQLHRRFGEIGDDRENLVRQLSLEQLEDLGEALLDFSSIEEVDRWIENN